MIDLDQQENVEQQQGKIVDDSHYNCDNENDDNIISDPSELNKFICDFITKLKLCDADENDKIVDMASDINSILNNDDLDFDVKFILLNNDEFINAIQEILMIFNDYDLTVEILEILDQITSIDNTELIKQKFNDNFTDLLDSILVDTDESYQRNQFLFDQDLELTNNQKQEVRAGILSIIRNLVINEAYELENVEKTLFCILKIMQEADFELITHCISTIKAIIYAFDTFRCNEKEIKLILIANLQNIILSIMQSSNNLPIISSSYDLFSVLIKLQLFIDESGFTSSLLSFMVGYINSIDIPDGDEDFDSFTQEFMRLIFYISNIHDYTLQIITMHWNDIWDKIYGHSLQSNQNLIFYLCKIINSNSESFQSFNIFDKLVNIYPESDINCKKPIFFTISYAFEYLTNENKELLISSDFLEHSQSLALTTSEAAKCFCGIFLNLLNYAISRPELMKEHINSFDCEDIFDEIQEISMDSEEFEEAAILSQNILENIRKLP